MPGAAAVPIAMGTMGLLNADAEQQRQATLLQQSRLKDLRPQQEAAPAAPLALPGTGTGEALDDDAAKPPVGGNTQTPADSSSGRSWGDALIALATVLKREPMQPPSVNLGGIGNPANPRGSLSSVTPGGRPMAAPGSLGQYF